MDNRAPDYDIDPIAVSIQYLKKQKLYQDSIARTPFLAIAEKNGSARVYHAQNISFNSYKKGILIDQDGNNWTVSESFLLGPNQQKLDRIPSYNAFWFAWFNAYPQTRLIH